MVKQKIHKHAYLRIFSLTISRSRKLIPKADLKWECPYYYSKFLIESMWCDSVIYTYKNQFLDYSGSRHNKSVIGSNRTTVAAVGMPVHWTGAIWRSGNVWSYCWPGSYNIFKGLVLRDRCHSGFSERSTIDFQSTIVISTPLGTRRRSETAKCQGFLVISGIQLNIYHQINVIWQFILQLQKSYFRLQQE